ncbi:tyrosyl-tRNA synthetase [Paramagnetospirillum caucaseum]|uniref:Tyrosine--tRNA ligase n=1 Tax=Paramagnetospirillum caucaseum TaxID=1244869 RepID=M3A958_9PROT|nr:tyrosine--tRNA ligase [Paramagnetospirillum caucaseum]EME69029.1 tyrosyl-tRNA synthetase [Paramagnetospirillum caucaseum]
MTSLKSDFLRVVTERGYMHQCTDLEALDKRLTEGCQAAYIGFDCTATSLHVGGLMQIMLLRWWQKTGHKPIVLMGGGTTRIGDPTGKDESRKMLTDEVIATNMAGIKTVFTKYLAFGDGTTDALMVNNADWLDKLNYIDFLRDYGHHFTINRMLTFDSVKLRLEREQPLTFLEFNYMLLQGYDFVELYRRNKCILQMGGSDQWGNIINGVELGRRADQAELFGLTSPLLTTSSGAKMGKTVNGAVWLNDDMLSAWEFWQYWRNTEDADVGRFLKLYTELPLDEIARLEKLEGAEINEAKKILANEVTRLCHGDEAAAQAAETARQTFEEGVASTDLPTVGIPAAELAAGIPAFALFVRAGLAASNGEARRLLKGGGGKVNDQAVDEARPVGSADLKDGSVKLTAGKKRHILVKAV